MMARTPITGMMLAGQQYALREGALWPRELETCHY